MGICSLYEELCKYQFNVYNVVLITKLTNRDADLNRWGQFYAPDLIV